MEFTLSFAISAKVYHAKCHPRREANWVKGANGYEVKKGRSSQRKQFVLVRPPYQFHALVRGFYTVRRSLKRGPVLLIVQPGNLSTCVDEIGSLFGRDGEVCHFLESGAGPFEKTILSTKVTIAAGRTVTTPTSKPQKVQLVKPLIENLNNFTSCSCLDWPDSLFIYDFTSVRAPTLLSTHFILDARLC